MARHAAHAASGETGAWSPSERLPLPVRVALLVLCGALYVWMATSIGLGTEAGAPDESMRSLMPTAIAAGNLFPSGYDPDAIYFLGNWSYAFYPQVLGAYASALFMWLAGLAGLSANAAFCAGRLASVCFGLVALAFASRTAERLAPRVGVDARLAGAGTIVLMGLWPQFAFLSSYMNNDIVALCGTVLITYALVEGLSGGWTTGRALALSAGVIVAALGYWNAYGFVLAGIVVFTASLLRSEAERGEKIRLFLTAAVPAAVCVLPFFALNVVRYGDLLGMATFREQYQLWLDEGGEVLQHPYGGDVVSLLLHSDLAERTWQSFIGVFGYMTYYLPFALYLAYTFLSCACAGSFLSRAFERRLLAGTWARVLAAAILLSCLVTVALLAVYAMGTDYQTQGRYVIYLLPPLVVAMALGVAPREGATRGGRVLACALLALFAIVGVVVLLHASAACGWNGVDVTLMKH